MKSEEIQEIVAQNRGPYELAISDLLAIQKAADYDQYTAVSYAYAYGFHRGRQVEKDGLGDTLK